MPSTQNGSIAHFFSYDPNENIFVDNTSDERLREALTHLKASMTNIYSYARTLLVEDETIDGYFCRVDGDSRLEQQGQFYLMAASTFTPPSGDKLPLGNLVMHYEVELIERGLDEDTSTMVSGFKIDQTPTVSNFFGAFTDNVITTIGTSWIAGNTGVTMRPYHLLIITFTQALTDTTDSSNFNVFAEDSPDTNMVLGTRGSVWYARISRDSLNYVNLFTSLGDALLGTSPVISSTTHTGTNSTSFELFYQVFDTRM